MRSNGLDRIFLVSIGIGFLITCFVVCILTYLDLRTEAKLDNEIEQIQNTLNQDKIDENKIVDLLNREVMKGSYQKIEVAYKDNVGNIINQINSIKDFNESVDLVHAFSSENIDKDGPDFVETKEKIEEKLKEYEEKNKELKKMQEDETLWSYLPEKRNSKFNKQYLKENIKNIFKTKYIKNILADFSKTKEILDQANSIVAFLEKTKDEWKINEDQLDFKDDTLEEEYKKLFNKWEELIK